MEGHFKMTLSKMSLDYLIRKIAFEEKHTHPTFRRKPKISPVRRTSLFRNGVPLPGFLLRIKHIKAGIKNSTLLFGAKVDVCSMEGMPIFPKYLIMFPYMPGGAGASA